MPSIEAAEKIADALEVYLDYLVGASSQTAFDKLTLDSLQELEQFEENKKKTLEDMIDIYIRDAKARREYSL